jgi:hypothetical protein
LATGAAPAAPVAIVVFRDDPAFAGRAALPILQRGEHDHFSRPVVFQAPLFGMAGGDGPGTAFMGTLEFRAETFNLTNTPQFQNPRGSVTSSTFGYVTSAQSSGTGVSGTGGGRALQLGLRLTF